MKQKSVLTLHHKQKKYSSLLKCGMALTTILAIYGSHQVVLAEEARGPESPAVERANPVSQENPASQPVAVAENQEQPAETLPANQASPSTEGDKEAVTSPATDSLSQEKPAGQEPAASQGQAGQEDKITSPANPANPVSQEQAQSQALVQENKARVTEDQEKQILAEREVNFNKGWHFKLNAEGDPSKPDIPVKDWKKLDLPHDWSIFFDFDHNSPARNEGGQLNGGVAWYRKEFTLEEDQKDKNVRIKFDGVYMESQVYVNGKFLGTYPSGYNHFSYDITDYLHRDGENVIAVKVTNKQPSSRWYSGSGIYRDVTLQVTDKVHVAVDGNKITSPKLAQQKDGQVETKVVNTSRQAAEVYVEHQIFKKGGAAVTGVLKSAIQKLEAGQELSFDQNLTVDRPTLWTVKSYNPQLYTLLTKVYKNGQLVDSKEDTFGYRYMEWTADDGFSLNGEYTKFYGVCIHHDNGALGAEENYKATYRKLKILKDMGVNAIRTSHNPASRVLLDIAAELGLMVQEEAFDTWYGGKKTYDYGRFFDQEATHPEAKKGEKWSDFDLRTMVERDKNNPAIVMWSLGNEVEEANGDDRSLETARRLVKIIKKIDTERYVTMGENKFAAGREGIWERLQDEFDVVGMNYGEYNYEKFRKKHPHWRLYGSETSSATRTRGSYFFPEYKEVYHDSRDFRNYEQSDYGNDAVSWGRTATASWTFDRDIKAHAGQFIWTGFDYIGEPTPWHNQDETPVKSSFFGIVDTTGIPKNDYYLYQSQWRSVKDKPMVHLLPHWNWGNEDIATYVKNKDGKIPVRAFSNASSVELFLNGQSLGKKEFVKKTTADGRVYQEGAAEDELYLEWLVDYKPGTLLAIARDENGKEIARDSVTTAGAPAKVRLVQEDHVIAADGKDLAYFVYEIVDADGNVVPTANNMVHFTIQGQGEIVGVDDGRQASRERYKAQPDGTWKHSAFHGKGVVIVKSTEHAGKFTLRADSRSLKSDSASVTTVENAKAAEKFVSYKAINLTVTKGETAQLPTEVTAVYADGHTENKVVTWTVDPAVFDSAGQKVIKGTVAGLQEEASLNLTVIAIKHFLPVVKKVAVNSQPADISTFVIGVMTDGSLKGFHVDAWTLDTPEKLAQDGSTIHASGKVGDQTVEATIQVSSAQSPRIGALTDLTIDGKTISGFAGDKQEYRLVLPYGSKVPVVGASASDDSHVLIDQASPENNLRATVYLVSNSSGKRTSYSVQFIEASPALTKLQLELVDQKAQLKVDDLVTYRVVGHYEDGSTVDFAPADVTIKSQSADGGQVVVKKATLQLYEAGHVTLYAELEKEGKVTRSLPLELTILANTGEKTITKLRAVTVSTDLNQAPNLPSQVVAEYDKGLSRQLPVEWEKIDSADLAHYHQFTLKGHVKGTTLLATATIIVEGIIAVEEISLTTPKGELPNLPESVRAYHSDGTTIYKAVTWDGIPESAYQSNGQFEVAGRVEGTDLKTKAHIRVSDQIVSGENISKQWTGSKLPAAMASHTGGTDHASKMNDTAISYNPSPDNRWTNWQTGNEEDWVGVLFGDAGDLTKRYVDNLHIDFYTDHAIGLPSKYAIEYYVGSELPKVPENLDSVAEQTDHPFNRAENWRSVENLKLDGGSLKEGATTRFSFDKVHTYAVRIRMTKKAATDGVGVTEFTIYANQVRPQAQASASLYVDGKPVPNFDPAVKEYRLIKESDQPQVSARVTNNGLATVIPSTGADTPTRVIVKAEDGQIVAEYRLYFEGQEKTLTDKATGISAVLPKDAPASIRSMKVKDEDEASLAQHSQTIKGLDLDLYDIQFADAADKEVAVKVPVKVTMPVAKGKKVANVLYFNPETDQIEVLDFVQKGDVVEFTASHFSIYGLSYVKGNQPVQPNQPNQGQVSPNQNQAGRLDNASQPQNSFPVVVAQKWQGKATQVSSPTKQAAGQLPSTGQKDQSASLLAGLMSLLAGFGLMIRPKRKD